MAWKTELKRAISRSLAPLNLRIETRTADRREATRLERLRRQGRFRGPVFPLPLCIRQMEPEPMLEDLPLHRERFGTFRDPAANDVGYSFENPFYSSPDAEVLYAMIRRLRPKTFLEIGSGNSTRVVRQAIRDGNLSTRLISIDPAPRVAVEPLSDEAYRRPAEDPENAPLFRRLRPGDVLFIDSSHEVKTGSDVVFLFLNVVPELPAGVVIHVHDIFLPYEYPEDWVVTSRWGWTEQYLLQAMLGWSRAFEVLWAAHFLQRTLPEFAEIFPDADGRWASSLWFRLIAKPDELRVTA